MTLGSQPVTAAVRSNSESWPIDNRPQLTKLPHKRLSSSISGYNNQMSSASQTQAPSPAIIFDTLNAHIRTSALRGAIELDLFTAIAEGSTSVEAIAKRIQASEKGTRVLCDYLTINGLLTKQDSHYGLTTDSAAFLNRHSPAYMGDVSVFINGERQMAGFAGLTQAVRQGGTVITEEGSLNPESPM